MLSAYFLRLVWPAIATIIFAAIYLFSFPISWWLSGIPPVVDGLIWAFDWQVLTPTPPSESTFGDRVLDFFGAKEKVQAVTEQAVRNELAALTLDQVRRSGALVLLFALKFFGRATYMDRIWPALRRRWKK